MLFYSFNIHARVWNSYCKEAVSVTFRGCQYSVSRYYFAIEYNGIRTAGKFGIEHNEMHPIHKAKNIVTSLPVRFSCDIQAPEIENFRRWIEFHYNSSGITDIINDLVKKITLEISDGRVIVSMPNNGGGRIYLRAV